VKKYMDIMEIFLLSFDALKERKARSALTILMVIVGSGLMITLNGIRSLCTHHYWTTTFAVVVHDDAHRTNRTGAATRDRTSILLFHTVWRWRN